MITYASNAAVYYTMSTVLEQIVTAHFKVAIFNFQ